VTWKLSPTENRFGFSKDFILFWSKSYWKFIPVFHLYVPATAKWPGHTCIVLPMSVIPKYFSCDHFFFAMLWDIIDLIFGMWVYIDKLQIKFTFRSGPVIFGRVVALGLWNFAKYLVVTTFFAMLGDIDLIFGYECIMMSYRSSLHFVPVQWFWPSYGTWTLKFGEIFSCHHFISLCLEILTWFLVYECIMMSLQIKFTFRSDWMIFCQLV
jgi:hypothetical protein